MFLRSPRSSSALDEYATATIYPSLSRPGAEGFQVLLCSSNEAMSRYIVEEAAIRSGVKLAVQAQPIAVARFVADLTGVGIAVADNAYCELGRGGEICWDLYHCEPSPALRERDALRILERSLEAGS